MMRFCVILIGLVASAAYSHDEVTLPELPIPAIDQLFPVDDIDAAFRWADRQRQPKGAWTLLEWVHDSMVLRPPNRWHIVALSESQFRQVGELLAGIQQTQNAIPHPVVGGTLPCEGLDDGRFGVYLQGWSQGRRPLSTGADRARNEYLWTLGAGLSSSGIDTGRPEHLLKNRFSVAGGLYAATDLRDTGFSMRFRFVWVDFAHCARHGHPRTLRFEGPYTDWIPIADLLDGNVAAPPAVEPEEPEEPTEPAEPDADALARLQAELDALRGDLSAVRDSVAFLLGGVDTVEVVRHDTLHYCPPTDEDRRDLFDLFTGVADDSSNVEGAGKAASVKPSSWGAIKALTRRER